uniref:G protein-coupled receptor n=1 Tax=Globodera pallida TaxID=36090 RepID=A0A183BMM6_GLOPA
MLLVSQIRIWATHVCFSLTLFFNLVLIWLVWTKTPKQMRFYSRVLLHTAIVDVLLLTVTELTRVSFFVHQNSTVIYMEGPLSRAFHSSTLVQFLFATLWIQIYFLSIFGQSIQFLYRYLVLNRNMKISLFCYLMMLFAEFGANTVFVLMFYLAGYPSEDSQKYINDEAIIQIFAEADNLKKPLLLAMNMKTNQPLFLASMIMFVSMNVLSYAIIIICSYKMIKFVQQNTAQKTQQEMEKQFTRSLIALAIIPVLSTCSNLIIGVGSIALGTFFNGTFDDYEQWIASSQMLAGVPTIFISVLNPLIIVFTIKPYRKALHSLWNRPSNAVAFKQFVYALPDNSTFRIERLLRISKKIEERKEEVKFEGDKALLEKIREGINGLETELRDKIAIIAEGMEAIGGGVQKVIEYQVGKYVQKEYNYLLTVRKNLSLPLKIISEFFGKLELSEAYLRHVEKTIRQIYLSVWTSRRYYVKVESCLVLIGAMISNVSDEVAKNLQIVGKRTEIAGQIGQNFEEKVLGRNPVERLFELQQVAQLEGMPLTEEQVVLLYMSNCLQRAQMLLEKAIKHLKSIENDFCLINSVGIVIKSADALAKLRRNILLMKNRQ